MYRVFLEDGRGRGNHPDIDISEVRKCIVSCLKSNLASIEDLRERLASQLSQPAVMGNTFRYLILDTSGRPR